MIELVETALIVVGCIAFIAWAGVCTCGTGIRQIYRDLKKIAPTNDEIALYERDFAAESRSQQEIRKQLLADLRFQRKENMPG